MVCVCEVYRAGTASVPQGDGTKTIGRKVVLELESIARPGVPRRRIIRIIIIKGRKQKLPAASIARLHDKNTYDGDGAEEEEDEEERETLTRNGARLHPAAAADVCDF